MRVVYRQRTVEPDEGKEKDMIYEMELNIVPIGKGRPRFGQGHAYTPHRTALYEREIRRSYKGDKFIGAVKIELDFGLQTPRSASKAMKAKMLAGEVYPEKKPDTDNLIKAVLDALNGVAYEDDKQIVLIIARKQYSEEPFVRVKIDNM